MQGRHPDHGSASPPLVDQGIAAPLVKEIQACRLCAERFAATATAHGPRPVVWFRPGARLLIAGQAPGARVHASGRPFTDRSGDRLRSWMGVTEAEFYDLSRVAILPMAFCFPGYDARGADLPPPPVCAATWRAKALHSLGPVRLTLLVGGAAIRWHLGRRDLPATVPATVPVAVPAHVTATVPATVTAAVADWRSLAGQGVFPLPHPSWRNTGWLQRNPWFEVELLPALRAQVRQVLND